MSTNFVKGPGSSAKPSVLMLLTLLGFTVARSWPPEITFALSVGTVLTLFDGDLRIR